jgi:uncharacterized membrane protein
MSGEKRMPPDRKKILRRLTFLAAPVLICLAFLLFFWFVYPPEQGLFSTPYLVLLGLLFAYLIPPLGKESIIPIAIAAGYPVWVISLGIILMDMVTAMFIALNFDLLLRVPLLGKLLRRLGEGAARIREKKPWIGHLSYAGLLIFMYIPIQGSGSMNTTILGRLLDLAPWKVYGIVTLGSILSTLTIALGFSAILELWLIHPGYAVLTVLVVFLVLAAGYRFWKYYTGRVHDI